MQRTIHKTGTIRQSILGLSEVVPEPPSFIPAAHGASASEAIILMATDWQWGEVVDLHSMDGVNCYNVEIARRRAERLFKSALELSTTYWTGPPPQRLILILGGDMISGEIHEELAKTNELLSLPALKDVTGYIIAGINLLLDKLDCPIDVIVIPGNHGRTTRRPESKLYVTTNYDLSNWRLCGIVLSIKQTKTSSKVLLTSIWRCPAFFVWLEFPDHARRSYGFSWWHGVRWRHLHHRPRLQTAHSGLCGQTYSTGLHHMRSLPLQLQARRGL